MIVKLLIIYFFINFYLAGSESEFITNEKVFSKEWWKEVGFNFLVIFFGLLIWILINLVEILHENIIKNNKRK